MVIENRVHAVIQVTTQVTHDRWELSRRVLDVEPETTVQEIIDWATSLRGDLILSIELTVERVERPEEPR